MMQKMNLVLQKLGILEAKLDALGNNDSTR